MVLWLKNTLQKRWKDILFALGMTCILMLPYIFKDFLGIEHDTFFHVSRIEQLSKSIQHGNFFPAIYPTENNNFGYASPLFYSDFFLIIPALLHLVGFSLAFCYKFVVFVASFLSIYTMILFTSHLTKKRSITWIAGCAYLFSNYRITDIYVRGALGEILAFSFLPLMLLGLYEIIEEDHHSYFTLTLSITCLALSHNLTFLLASVLCALFVILSIHKLTKEKFICIFVSVLFAFLLSCFFTLPMIEQLKSQSLIVDYYGTSSDLSSHSMNLWQFFVNEIIFGYSGNTYERSMTMTVNVGWFLTFIPITYLFVKKKDPFIMKMMIIGYICMILPSSLFPWDKIPLQSLQFPWRLNTIAMLLLSVPATLGITNLFKKRFFHYVVIGILCMECVYHVYPAFSRTFGITSKTTWADILDGELCDPYYSAYYVRVELAGADYLPLSSPDFRERTTAIKDAYNNDLDISYSIDYDSISFSTESLTSDTQLVLPKTWYKGYTVYQIKDGKKVKVECSSNTESMVTFYAQKDSEYILTYEDTLLRKICLCTSLVSFIIWIITLKKVSS